MAQPAAVVARLMRAAVLALLAVTMLPRVAAGQPGQTPSYARRYHLLGEEDRELIARGEIPEGQVVAGGLVGTFVGFGIGHAIQGRYLEKGWMFTLGDTIAAGMLVKAMVDCGEWLGEEGCEHDGWFAGGMLVAIGVRLWQVIDVWYGPSVHNGRVRQARWRAGLPAAGLVPVPGGATAGLTLRF